MLRVLSAVRFLAGRTNWIMMNSAKRTSSIFRNMLRMVLRKDIGKRDIPAPCREQPGKCCSQLCKISRHSGKVFEEQLKTTPKMDNYSPVSTIRGLLDSHAAAVCNRDIAAASANYAMDDVLIFDVVGPLQHHSGISSVRNRVEGVDGGPLPEGCSLSCLRSPIRRSKYRKTGAFPIP